MSKFLNLPYYKSYLVNHYYRSVSSNFTIEILYYHITAPCLFLKTAFPTTIFSKFYNHCKDDNIISTNASKDFKDAGTKKNRISDRVHSQSKIFEVEGGNGSRTIFDKQNAELLYKNTSNLYKIDSSLSKDKKNIFKGTFLPSTDGLNNRIATRAKNKHKKREKARHNSKFQGKALEFRICKALCTSEAFNLEALTSLLHSKDFKITSFSSVGEETDVIHVYSFSERGEIFFFKSGTIVLWNISNSEMLEVNKLLHKIEVRPYISKIVAEEEIYYKIDDSRESTLVSENIIIFSGKHDRETLTFEKYAASDALALSAKLDIWENMLEELVDEISYIPTSMKSGTCFNISRRSLEKKTGQLLYLRSNINLVSHLLSPPDFYWDRPLLESIYTAVCNRQLDIESRTEVANNRLTHTGELLALLRENKHYQVAESLELAILVLIFVEIILEVYRHYQNL